MTVAGIAGTLLSLFVLAGAVSSVIMDKLVGVFGRFTGAAALAITLIGNIIIASATSVAMFTIGIFVFGFGWCLVIPVINLECGNVTNKAGLAMVASLVMVAMNLGNFLASYYMGAVFGIVGNDPTMCLWALASWLWCGLYSICAIRLGARVSIPLWTRPLSQKLIPPCKALISHSRRRGREVGIRNIYNACAVARRRIHCHAHQFLVTAGGPSYWSWYEALCEGRHPRESGRRS
jgi:MFS family permease